MQSEPGALFEGGMVVARVISVLDWGETLPLEVVEVGPRAGASTFEQPGPRRRPVRPHLECSANGGRVVGRVLLGSGRVLAKVALLERVPKVVSLPASPLALLPREDGGLWVLSSRGLAHHAADGKRVQAFEVPGQVLVGAPASGVWAIDINADVARFVSADGHSSDAFPWPAGAKSTGSQDGTLYGVTKGISPTICSLTADGKTAQIAPPGALGPMERLLTYTEARITTVAGPFLRKYDADGTTSQLTIQSAGLTDTGGAFVAGRDGAWINVWTEPGSAQRLAVPPDFSKSAALTVVAVDGERNLVYGLDFASWYVHDRPVEPIKVDDVRYRNDVFPFAWELGSVNAFEGTPDGKLYLSTSGPAGVAVLELDW